MSEKIKKLDCSETCSVERGMRVIGGKWTGAILWHLKDEKIRFNELTRMLPGASKKMINQRLKELEELGLIKREVLHTRPIAVAYSLTSFGESAFNILDSIREWVETESI